MMRNCKSLSVFFVLALLSQIFCQPTMSNASQTLETPKAALVEIGRKLYQQGRKPDGLPVKAFVLGNVEVSGNQFPCMNCHRRSGLGGPEGTKFVLPTNGRSLLTPRVDIYMARPAYTLASFGAALGQGVNPKGQIFDPVMPIYELTDPEVRALFSYLETLSFDYSPGLTDEVLHVATVIDKSVDSQTRKEMMTVLETFFANKNAKTRNEQKRQKFGPFYQEYRNKAYRKWIHHIWELSGPAESWPEQLETYYQQQPVFAMVSGMVSGEWKTIHEFCQLNKIPCLLPNTNLPVVNVTEDFYTLYYSKGLALEAQVLAVDAKKTGSIRNIVQVYQPGSAGETGARVLHANSGLHELKIIDIALTGKVSWSSLWHQLINTKTDAIVLWLDANDLDEFAKQFKRQPIHLPIYISSLLINGDPSLLPESIRKNGRLIHPFNLPEEHKSRFFLVDVWLRGNKIPLSNPRIQGQTYYSCLILNAGLNHIKRYFYREYLLDLIDHGGRMAQYSGNYPRLSFGPEQRFLAKGAYVINLLTNDSNWIVPD